MSSPAMPAILITNGRVIDPSSGLDRVCDVAVVDGLVAAIGPGLSRGPAQQVIEADGCIVAPGLIDPHVHLREPGNERAETIESGGRAAVSGGFTTVCCMPNTAPALDNDALAHFVLSRAEATAACRVFPVCAATRSRRGEELAEIALMARAGAVGFSDDGDCIASAGMMSRVLAAVKPTGLAFMQHCQEPTLTRGGVMHAGAVSTRLDLGGWPRAAEEVIIERDLRLNRAHGCAYHVQHISSGESAEIVRAARAAGQPVTAEATPHHLLLTCDLIEASGYDTRYKVNPPIRERADIDALKRAIADGTITVLGTDHAPHASETKDAPFDSASFGMIGLETALPLYMRALLDDHVIDWPRLIALLTIEPARLCRLDARGLGALRVGGPADVTVIDPNMPWTCTRSELAGRSWNTPFLGWKLRGRAASVIVGGVIQLRRDR
ncbi:dihydroorotase [soil metagenome]